MSRLTAGFENRGYLRLHRQFTRDLPARYGRANEAGLQRAADFILKESNKNVPYEFGDLRDSGAVAIHGRGTRAEAHVFYSEDYAVAVHENMEMKLAGEPRPSGRWDYWDAYRGQGTHKYLERVALEQQRQIQNEYRLGAQAQLRDDNRAVRAASRPATYTPTAFV